MSTIDEKFAHAFAEEWVAAWNARDLDRVLAHYTDDFEFSSPLINAIVGEPSGTLQGKVAVRAYWQAALDRVAYLRFALLDVLIGVNSITLYYRGHRGNVAETFHFNASGKVQHAFASYANY